jgi:transcriptional regulator with XRE-family HTH domain
MNSKALRAELILKGKKTDEIAIEIGISKSAFYRKLKGKSSFTQKEICKLGEALDISNDKIMEIFFAEKVS